MSESIHHNGKRRPLWEIGRFGTTILPVASLCSTSAKVTALTWGQGKHRPELLQ